MRLVVDGTSRELADHRTEQSLLRVLREELGVTTAKNACEQGECGSCTVSIDGEIACACLVLAAQLRDGAHVVTASAAGRELEALRTAFVSAGAIQCGFCTPGLIVAAADLLHRITSPTEDDIREALANNLCRCTGYHKIIAAVEEAADELAHEQRRRAAMTEFAIPGITARTHAGQVGDPLRRRDGGPKADGSFIYASDLRRDGMLFGATTRSQHPSALIRGISVNRAADLPGVRAVLTHEDVPGERCVGMGEIHQDQPVLAFDRVRYHGEPIAIVAADDPDTARRAAELIDVDYAPLQPIVDPERALDSHAAPIHPWGNEVRTVRIACGDPEVTGDVVVSGTYTVGIQEQAFLGPEAGLAFPDGRGGVELHVATQWLHSDHAQIVAGLDLRPEQVRLVMAGVGGAFGGREDLSVQLHACMLALATGRPVRMVYSREESFVGHPHRHPAKLTYEHHATRDGRLVCVRGRLVFDGGAYESTSASVVVNATTCAAGPYAVENVSLDGTVAYTNNPPAGAMRGFGAVQVAIGYEAQMDRLAIACGLSPLEVRRRNLLRDGGVLPYGQVVPGPVGTNQLLDALERLPLPGKGRSDPRARPGSTFQTTLGGHVKRGVGYAAGFKNIAFSEGYDDASAARVVLENRGGLPVATVHSTASEVGQGVMNVQEQIAREELGPIEVQVMTADTRAGDAGAASSSRLTWILGGALQGACRRVREQLSERAARDGRDDPYAERDEIDLAALAEILADQPVEAAFTYHHRHTVPLGSPDGDDVHAGFSFVAHRAVVEVDVELGVARVVELVCAQDVGRAVNPLALEGQIEGGSIQGLGLALTEELIVEGGLVRTRSLGAYRIPTIVDAPPVRSVILELSDPDTPYGVKGAAELPSVTSTPAVLAALRDATGQPVTRAPARLEDLVEWA